MCAACRPHPGARRTSRTPVPKYIYKHIFSHFPKDNKEQFEDLFCDIQNNSTLVKTDIKTGETKTKKALKKEIFKAEEELKLKLNELSYNFEPGIKSNAKDLSFEMKGVEKIK